MLKKIVWKDRAKAELRAIEHGTAMRILHALARIVATGEGDVKRGILSPQNSVSASGSTVCASGKSTALSKSSQ
jgi:hypothetical protein